MGEDVNRLIRKLKEEFRMLHENIIDANRRRTWKDRLLIYTNGRSTQDQRKEYTKFMDYKGRNLFVSKQDVPIGKLKGHSVWAYEGGIRGKVIEIDRGAMFIIGDYISKDITRKNK